MINLASEIPAMRVLSVLFFIIGAVLAVGGVVNASKPSVSPIITVLASFMLPTLFIWWGLILHKKANSKKDERR